MPVNLFPNASEAELRALVESLQKRLTIGEIQFVTLPGGGQMQRTFQNTRDAKTMLIHALYSWHKMNPSEVDNPYAQRIRRTLPNYVNAP
jgi:hypothetical protein